MDDNHIIGALFLDISKAFDKIDSELLLTKMKLEFDIVQKAHEWF